MLAGLLWWLPGLGGDSPSDDAITPEPARETGAVPWFVWPIYSDASNVYAPTLSGGSWRGTLPLANLQHRALVMRARSVNVTEASTQFDCDLQTARLLYAAALVGHNLTEDATVRWLASDVAGDFSAPLYDSGWRAARLDGLDDEQLDGLTRMHVHPLDTATAARYWRCRIRDTTNPAGYVDVGRLVLGGRFTPSTGMALGMKLSHVTQTQRIETDGGAAVYNAKPMVRTWDFQFPRLEDDETFGDAWHMVRRVGTSGQVLFLYNPRDQYMHERAMLCVLRETSAVEFPEVFFQWVPFRLIEEL